MNEEKEEKKFLTGILLALMLTEAVLIVKTFFCDPKKREEQKKDLALNLNKKMKKIKELGRNSLFDYLVLEDPVLRRLNYKDLNRNSYRELSRLKIAIDAIINLKGEEETK